MPQTSSRVRWRVVLPIVMVFLSAFLTLIARAQQRTMHSGGMGTDVPARIIQAVINGPGYALAIHIPVLAPDDSPNRTFYYEAQTLLGMGFFWFLIGLAIDRRNKPGLSRRFPVAGIIVFTLAAAACGGLAGLAVYQLFIRDAQFNWMILTHHPLRTWRTVAVGLTLWFLGFFVYFARQSFVAWNTLRENRN